jgi:parallel beta helix pectate lyase-like protein
MEAAPAAAMDRRAMDTLWRTTAPLGALACVLALLALTPAQASACSRVAAPGGSDNAAGTAGAPYATFKKLAHSVAPGQAGCLRGGTYQENVEVNANGAPGAPITIQSYPGEWATFLGRLTTDKSSSYLTFQSMTFDGSTAPSDGSELKPSPTVHGESISFIGNEVTNRHTAICFAVGNEQYGRAPHVVIRRNRIHDCGQLPPTNHQHGIYLHSPCCAQVTDNWVYDNADTGIQMFPDADGNYIARNVVYGNGDNISFGGDSKDGGCASSDDNLIERNVLSHPRVKENVGSWSGCGQHGTGNVLRENCIWPPTFQKAGVGFTLLNNFYVAPAYVNAAAKDFRIVPGTPCAALVTDPGVGHTGGSRKAGKRLVLKSSRRFVRVGGRFVLSGTLAGATTGQRVRIQVRRRSRWLRVRAVRVRAGGRFRAVLRLRLRRQPVVRLQLGVARLPRNARTLRLRATATGAGSSAVVVVRIRR